MRLSKVDLNLFVVFDVIYTERHITRAAEVLCLTQPTVSNSLARLRRVFNDELFVRTPQGMAPTPVADNIIGRVREALQLFDASVREGDQFDPASSDRTFRFSMNDLAESLLLPGFMDAVGRLAPQMVIESYYSRRRELPVALASGEIDLAIEAPLLADPNLCHTPLLSESYVCMVRPDHPLVRGSLSLDQYLQLGHIHISSRRKGPGHVDMALHSLGHPRQIRLRVQHYQMAPQLVARSDLALTVPRRLARQFALQVLELPFAVPPLEWHLFWHKSADGDQGNRWLRERVLGA
jgi:DNA-binding transcriptional LysR family regulator